MSVAAWLQRAASAYGGELKGLRAEEINGVVFYAPQFSGLSNGDHRTVVKAFTEWLKA